MERFNALGRGAQILLVCGVLLFIDLFLPWQDFDVGGIAEEFGVDATFSGWRGIGAVLGILAIILVAWIGLRVAGVDLNLPVSTGLITAVLGALVLIFGIIKFITIVDDEPTIWAWIGLLLTLAIGVGTWLVIQAAGGIDSMRSEATTFGSGLGSSRDTSETTVPPAGAAPTEPPASTPSATEPVAPPAPSPPPVTHPEPPADADEPPRSSTT